MRPVFGVEREVKQNILGTLVVHMDVVHSQSVARLDRSLRLGFDLDAEDADHDVQDVGREGA